MGGERLIGKIMMRFFLPAVLLAAALPFTAAGCSPLRPEGAAEQFFALWSEENYPAMYELLESGSREKYSEEYFAERYSNISRGMGLLGVEITGIARNKTGVKGAALTLSARLGTSTVGPVPVTYTMELSRARVGAPWLLRWHPGLILPELSDDTRAAIDPAIPRRGAIYDRHGRLLAGPQKFRELGAVPGTFADEDSFAGAVESLTGFSQKSILEKLRRPWVREGLYVPLYVLTAEEEELIPQLLQIPGVMINDVERRVYPAAAQAAHLMGYMGEITAEELAADQEWGYGPGDLVGKMGLEAALERRLAGSKGYELSILDQEGTAIALIAKKALQEGEDINLTIDLDLQGCAAEAMGAKKGAVIALDPRSGEVLVLYSNPGFDPNLFVTGLSTAAWQSLQGDPAQPLLNRALSGIYPPGSAFKPFTAAAAVAEKVIDPAARMEILGELWQPSPAWGGYYVRRVHSELESVNMGDALKYSDNIYFARIGLTLGEEKFMEYGERFGFGEAISFTLPVARSRLAPEGMKSEIQLADSSYGQGDVMATPLQMALLYCAFANGGTIPQPSLLLQEKAGPWREKVIEPEVVGVVHRALVETLHGEGAPAASGAVEGFRAAGKTGTAEVERGEGNICWYVTYGPAEAPSIVVAVVVEEGSWAGTDALPVGRAVLERYLNPDRE